MDPTVNEWLNLVFRWVHVVAGITWIGLLYFFNWINGAVMGALDADSKKKLTPELLPRALYWFRWGAAYTWITGILLLGIVYYMGGILVEPESGLSVGAGTGIGLGILVVGWVVYDMLWKAVLSKNEMVGMVVSLVLAAAVAFGLSMVMTHRAAFIHVGALFGTLMAANVWMRIWPNQRRIIKSTVDGSPADASWAAVAKLRSKHNTYMSVPLVFTMISNHFPGVYGPELAWVYLTAIIIVGWLFVKWAYGKSATAAPKFY